VNHQAQAFIYLRRGEPATTQVYEGVPHIFHQPGYLRSRWIIHGFCDTAQNGAAHQRNLSDGHSLFLMLAPSKNVSLSIQACFLKAIQDMIQIWPIPVWKKIRYL
jgi:hypothetical protein